VDIGLFLDHIPRGPRRDCQVYLPGEGQTVEADETWVGGKAANRAYGPIPPKHAVAALVERGGRLRMFHVPHVTASNLAPLIARHAHPAAGS
jgi:hypothetical protein